MELYFLRHAIAGQHGDPRYKDDSLRPLTDEGKQKMRRAALGIKALDLGIDVILSSPYLRARQTAEIVADTCKPHEKKIHLTKNLLPPASIQDLLGEIHDRFPGSGNIMAVGHEPHLSELVSDLLKSGRPLAIDFKKGGLCSLSVDRPAGDPQAVLNWLLTPSQLGLMK
jgi:phosphohistidine phosphatase